MIFKFKATLKSKHFENKVKLIVLMAVWSEHIIYQSLNASLIGTFSM